MKCRMMKNGIWRFQWILLSLFTLCCVSCKDDEKTSQAVPYNPSLPVEITGFTPDTGGGGTRMVVYGKNFGTDVSLMKLTVGGLDAKIINVLGDCMYCTVPQKAYSGNLVLTVGEGEQAQTVEAEKKFTYVKQMVVSTLCGNVDEKGKFDVKEGPFDDCGGFDFPSWFSFDPSNKDILYLAQDNQKPMRVLDLKNKYVYDGVRNGEGGLDRMRTITWTLDGDTMIVANDRPGDTDPNNVYIVRNTAKALYAQFKDNPRAMQQGKGCNGSAVHPNGELYYNSYGAGEVFRYDYWKAKDDKGGFDYSIRQKLFNIQDKDWEFNIVIHPTGTYAYIVVINQHYIMRTDYDKDRKTFGTPYLICGLPGKDNKGWVDAVGEKVRLNEPYQGVFVLDTDPERKGDKYDFYFTDKMNHCIRILTPDGQVTTFAGRGSSALNGDPWGYVNGALRSEARFDRPCALAYDEDTKTFYVGDTSNHRIRKIAMEEGDEQEESENN